MDRPGDDTDSTIDGMKDCRDYAHIDGVWQYEVVQHGGVE